MSRSGLSVDGSKFEASASKHRSVTYERAGQLIDQLELDIADLMERAAAADGEGPRTTPRRCPRRSQRREALCSARCGRRARLEAERAATRPSRGAIRETPHRPGLRASTRSRPTRRRAPTSRAI